jgi:DNA-binding NarL/FixJ family response regulator
MRTMSGLPKIDRIRSRFRGLRQRPKPGHPAHITQRWRFAFSSISGLGSLLMFAKKPTSVLIVESQPELLLKFATAVEQDEGLNLAAAVSTGTAALVVVEQSMPDVLLLDLAINDLPAVEVIRQVVWSHPETEVVVLTQFGNDEQVLACIEAGASGYFFKDEAEDGFSARIHGLRAGGAPISPGMARRVLGRFRLRAGVGSVSAWSMSLADSIHPLSEREADILRWVARGMSLEQISELAGCPSQSLLCHVKTVYRKLAAQARGEALAFCPESDAAHVGSVSLQHIG